MSVTILHNNAPALAALLEKAAMGAVKASCDVMKEACEEEVHIRTSSLQVSFYTAVAGEESGYETAAADARSKNPKVVILEEVKPDAPNSGLVSAAAGHSVYQEFGTIHNAPVPAMHQAADQERQRFKDRVAASLAAATE